MSGEVRIHHSMRKRKKRVDSLMVEKGLVASLPLARALLMAGKVVVEDQRVSDASACFEEKVQIRIRTAASSFVGRGGDKLQGAIQDLGLQEAFVNKMVLDIGASTGGFTQCLLEAGAEKVLALDVGHNQLAWSLRQDPRVLSLEQTDIRKFDASGYPALDWVVGDMSFISLAQLAQQIFQVGGVHTQFLLLVKPQFELERSAIPAGGVVTDPAEIHRAVIQVQQAFEAVGGMVKKTVPSRVKGKTGNQEIFLWICKAGQGHCGKSERTQ
jgi:23S rRNA (cytidine1920-2'-O)/16S rRNA (cytidine1409-2'-O)-methyltransferase